MSDMTRICLRFLLSLGITRFQRFDFLVITGIHDFYFFYARYDDTFLTISAFLRRNSSVMSDMTIPNSRFDIKRKWVFIKSLQLKSVDLGYKRKNIQINGNGSRLFTNILNNFVKDFKNMPLMTRVSL